MAILYDQNRQPVTIHHAVDIKTALATGKYTEKLPDVKRGRPPKINEDQDPKPIKKEKKPAKEKKVRKESFEEKSFDTQTKPKEEIMFFNNNIDKPSATDNKKD